MTTLKDIRDVVVGKLWRDDLDSLGKGKRFGFTVLRIGYILVQGLTEEQLVLRAMSLVYATLLSLVPLLAVSFSVLKAFGYHAQIGIFLYYSLEPLGPKGTDIALNLIEFVERVNAGVLGSIGVSLLIFTVLSIVQKVEKALNEIWHVETVRGFAQRFSSYMSVILIGPVFLVSAMSLTASLMSSTLARKMMAIEPFGTVVFLIGKAMPVFLVCTAFTFVYMTLPNTKVYLKHALVGGSAAALLWQVVAWVFTAFVASSAQYSAIYSGFAALIVFLIWLYMNWLVLFVGARVVFSRQSHHYVPWGQGTRSVSPGRKESLGLAVMLSLCEEFFGERGASTLDSLSRRLGIPVDITQEMLTILEEGRLIIRSTSDPPSFVPARDPEVIAVKEVMDVLRLSERDGNGGAEPRSSIPVIDALLRRVDEGRAVVLQGETMKSLLLRRNT